MKKCLTLCQSIFACLFFGIAFLQIQSCTAPRAQCPAYARMGEGTISVQEEANKTPEEIQKESKRLLESQDFYISVVRDKKTGLVKSKKKIKKGKNNTNTHKGFQYDPRTLKGVDSWR
ncbi:MAG: hypothetical protein NZ551_10545 [Microscillaceae bacterium]|nr:hypothetical protein [Microscillaceae bacterium]MDW8461637.1 hypothetical protein [Cytophagales bacterium]